MSTDAEPIQITRFRLSLIWAETVLTLLNADRGGGTPFTFSGFKRSYTDYFDNPLSKGNTAASKTPASPNEPINLRLPWNGDVNQAHFWRYMLERREGDTSPVTGNKAWKALIPLCGPSSILNAPWWPGSVELTPFFYPFGVGLVLNAEWDPSQAKDSLSLKEMIEAARNIRIKGSFDIEASPGQKKNLPADALATNMLISLRKAAFGESTDGSTRVADMPFSILTVLKGTGIRPQVGTPYLGEVHKALEAVTFWDPNYDVVLLHALDPDHVARLRHNGRALSDLVFMGERGRAVWFPRWFTNEDATSLSTLGCYHNNLVSASLHVDSLSGLLRESAAYRRDGRSLTSAHEQCARLAAGSIARLYSGKKAFRSWSPRAQIEQNGFLDDINRMREWLVASQDITPLGTRSSQAGG